MGRRRGLGEAELAEGQQTWNRWPGSLPCLARRGFSRKGSQNRPVSSQDPGPQRGQSYAPSLALDAGGAAPPGTQSAVYHCPALPKPPRMATMGAVCERRSAGLAGVGMRGPASPAPAAPRSRSQSRKHGHGSWGCSPRRAGLQSVTAGPQMSEITSRLAAPGPVVPLQRWRAEWPPG